MTTPAPTNPSTTATSATTENLPSIKVLYEAAKIAIEQDKAIMLDYYRESIAGTALLGVDPKTKDRLLLKSKDEFTSLISKAYRVDDDLIIVTENSLYIVAYKIGKRSVNLASLYESQEASL